MEEPHRQLPQILSPCSTSGRRRNCNTINSPEFEFQIVHNPSFPQPNLLSADELFSGGFLLPLHLLQPSTEPPPPPPQHNEVAEPDKTPESETSTTEPVLNNSKRWRHIFKKNDQSKDVSVREKREKKNGWVKVASAAELNINIWPFSRSRSAGNGGARPRAAATTRKVSSAPCSRSNSTGHESKCRKWAHSPNRAGVHLGRNSPVWQLRRGGGGEKGAKRDGNEGRRKMMAPKGRALSLNVPMCIGYRSNLSCRHDESSVAAAAVGGSENEGGVSDEVIRSRGRLFNIRSLFTKRVH